MGRNLLAGDYSVTEDDPAPEFDLSELTCTATSGSSGTTDLATRTASISLAAGGTVDCTFTNRQRGGVTVHKQDDAGDPLAGAVFTPVTDNPPLGGDPPHGAEDTSTGKSCTTGADGNCTITEVAPGRYWVVDTTSVPGHDTAADQNVVVGAGETVGPLTFVDPRQHVVIVLVCHQGHQHTGRQRGDQRRRPGGLAVGATGGNHPRTAVWSRRCPLREPAAW